MGNELFTVPATDVPVTHYLQGGYFCSGMFTNRSANPAAYFTVRFEDGTQFRLYGGESVNFGPEDTSATFTSGKVWAHFFIVTGDAANSQVAEFVYTVRKPYNEREQVSV